MRYLVSTWTAALFFIWILPLGFFIKPAQEKIACGGQRALCLCSPMKAQAKGNSMEGFSLKADAGSNKESNASGGGAGHYDLAAHQLVSNALSALALNDSMFLAYRNPFLKSIEHIPKA